MTHCNVSNPTVNFLNHQSPSSFVSFLLGTRGLLHFPPTDPNRDYEQTLRRCYDTALSHLVYWQMSEGDDRNMRQACKTSVPLQHICPVSISAQMTHSLIPDKMLDEDKWSYGSLTGVIRLLVIVSLFFAVSPLIRTQTDPPPPILLPTHKYTQTPPKLMQNIT